MLIFARPGVHPSVDLLQTSSAVSLAWVLDSHQMVSEIFEPSDLRIHGIELLRAKMTDPKLSSSKLDLDRL